jgi:small-conductance mechanosensitive channel
MAKAQKPTKQQIEQAKARAGGNNPIKVTNAGLKKFGSAAVVAASLTPVGRAAKTAGTVAKAAAKVVGKQTTKQAIPTKIKTPTQSYDIKQTATGKIKATNTKTGISVTFPKDTKLNINKIKQAHAQKFINKSK